MKHPLLTVIIAAYNCEKSILSTLESIQQQSYTHLQVIIVNDGSTDATWEVVQKFCANDARFVVLDKENGGVSSARNKALSHIKGAYVIFSDADDLVLPGAYDYLINAAIESDSDIVIADYLKGTADDYVHVTHDTSIENENVLISNMLRGKTHGALWNKLFKSHLFKSHRFSNGIDFMEDMLLLVQFLLIDGIKINVVTGTPIYHYFINPNSYTNSLSKKYIKIGDQVVTLIEKLLPKERFQWDIIYLKAHQKLLYLIHCDTQTIKIKHIYPEINSVITSLELPLKYKVLLQVENIGYTFLTRLYKKLK